MSDTRRNDLVLTREQVRAVDRIAIQEYGLQGVVLMENAGRGAAELLLRQHVRGRVVICCGRGNNGGDGFVIARHLENAGIDVQVLLLVPEDSVTGDAAVNLRVLKASQTPLSVLSLPHDNQTLAGDLAGAEWVVDALLGTGASGVIREPYATAIDLINRAARPVLAVDLPSGLDCDSGATFGPCVRARMTATFVAQKPGFSVATARPFLGEIHVIDIGVPIRLLTSLSPRQESP